VIQHAALIRVVCLLSIALAWLPLRAAAQQNASIAGLVTDASGSVLPGVTVEATSPALIEKVRVVVTDGTGQYRIVDLRPGIYTVTFQLRAA
jgi:protocatechuate 3,4-dioxygenase beta subunit